MRDVLDLSMVTRLLDDAAELGCLFVSLTGGEVLAHPDWRETVAYARHRQFDVRIQTSGWLLDDPAAAFLREQAISEVHISMYSAEPSVHDKVTGVPGSHHQAVSAACALRSREVRVVLKNVVTSINASTYRTVAALAKDLDCEYAMDATVTPRESGSCAPCELRPDGATLRDFYGEYAWSQFAARFGRGKPLTEFRPLDDSPCLAGTTFLFVASDGTVYPCVDLKLECGNLVRESLSAIWKASDVLQRVRRLTWRDLPECSTCQLREYCSHCPALSLTEHGDLKAPARENCRHALVKRDLLRERGLVSDAEPAARLPPCAHQDE